MYFQKIGVTLQKMERYETGKERVSASTLYQIQRVLGNHIFSNFKIFIINYDCSIQKHPSGLRCSENMQQIYRRTPMPKCDFNKVAVQLY